MAAAPNGSANSARAHLFRHDHPVLHRQIVAPQPHWVDQHQLTHPLGRVGGVLGGDHAAE
jgi:hypothetical protein